MTHIKFTVISLFPEMFEPFSKEGVFARAIESKIVSLQTVHLRDFALDARRNVDGAPVGGGDGMVLLPEVCKSALDSVLLPHSKVILLSPTGKVFSQNKAKELSKFPHLVFLCGRYAGFDRRFEDMCAHETLSLGDFVLSGGEIPAMAVMDAVSRCVPGVLGNTVSAGCDSHSDGLLEHGQYAKPNVWNGQSVPEELLSGDHKAIERHRRFDALKVTAQNRPDLIDLVWETLTRSEKAFVSRLHKHG